jgi:hypothetical protein
MIPLRVSVLLWLTAFALSAGAADGGLYTIAEGDARVLRGTTWYKLAPGTRVQEGDVVDLGERAGLQVELAGGITLNVAGPGTLLAALVPAAERKGVPESTLLNGWAKVAGGPAPGVRLRAPTATLEVADAIVVVAADPATTRFFVESGTLKVTAPVARGKEAPAREARAGELWSRTGERALSVDARALPAFVAAMPRGMRDPLPRLSARFKAAPPPPPPGAEVSFAEAEPWLAGPYRRAFVKRFTSRLADPSFRAGAEGRSAAYPEWDRLLHPEKYAEEPTPPRK